MKLQFVIKDSKLLDIELVGASGLELIGSNSTLKEVLETKLYHYENLLQGKPDIWTYDFVINSIEKEKRSTE